MARYGELREWLAPTGLKPVAVYLSNRFSWSARLSNGMLVSLGREQVGGMSIRELVDRMVQAYPQLLARFPGRIDSMDLRYPNGLALNAGGQAAEAR